MGLIISAAFARGDYETINIAADEKIAEYIRFDAESWDDVEGESLEGGRLIENAIWEGKHIIHSDFYIPSGVTLTINPGAQISFDDGVILKVEDGGSLNLIGEEGNEVVIRGSDKKGIVLQSSAANYYDNNYVDIDGFNFSRFASFSISDTDAFFASGVARVPVNVSGSRNQPFSFDWVATVNGDTLVEGTMSWNNVSEGKKEIVVNFPTELKDVTEIKIQVVKSRCAIAARNEAKINLSAFMTLPIETDEEIGEYIAFESEEWNLALGGEAGRLSQNTIWEGEHIVTGIVYIPSGVTLTIRPGAVIKFAAGTYIKIEDGATLNLYGEEGNDIVLKGLEKDTAFTGLVKMSSGTVNENEFVQIEGFTFGTFPRISLNNSETFRTSGLAIIPVTISGSRSSAFSFEWVAETNNVPYKTGRVRWGSTNDGTKNININFGSELDGLDSFVVRAVTNRVSYASPSSCTVKIADFDHLDIEVAENQAEYIRFSRPEGEYDGGRLDVNTTWEGLHTIGSDLYIPSGVTLTISAGTIVEFTEGTMIKIEDGGALNVVGANGNDVIFKKAEGVENCVGLNKMNSGSYTDNMYVQFVGVPYGGYPYVSVNPATTYRETGKIYVAFTLSGATRDQSFNLDWKTAKGQTGTVSWSRSSDGTRWAEIPVDSTTTGGTEEYAIEITAARACNPSTAKNTITILEPDFVDTTGVSMTTEITSSKSFKIDEAIKRHSIFLNEVEPVRYSGIWREHSEEAVKQQVVLESDNGRKILVEAGLGESGEIAFRPNDYPTGYYELKHEIVDRTGDALETLTKVFSVPELDDVVLHGGTITSNELWKAGKVHVVYEPISVPALYTLLIEPGAIVKFYTNSGITLQNGAALFANGIVFTHIDDDTVGGDTLSDGFTALPPMDAYYLNGDFTFGDDAELRNITQKTALSGTLSGAKMLSKGSTYRVSGNFTIANGGKLTIPAGTILKMEAGAQITVNAGGELIANGSRAAPIVITSIRDDSISGDTNGDGDKTLPQPGDWRKISVSGKVDLSSVKILYGAMGTGTDDAILVNSSGIVNFSNCELAHGQMYAIGVESGGHFYATNSIVRDFYCAFRHWPNDEFVNCVFYDCSRLANNNGQKLRNCIVMGITEAWDWSSGNGVEYHNCVAWNPPGFGLQTPPSSLSVENGNIWGDPLFVDAENGDFRIQEGSPCVDAADEESAPELDYFGQPRVNAPDIGICELLPRDVTSDIDLVPESVRADQEVKPGQLIFVKWTIRNAGGAVVDATWRDTVSLVSTSGREIVLGEKMTTGIIAVGGTIFCSGYFTVPALEEGEWYPKVNVNSYHDIFEGLLSKNNALVGTDAVNVKINEVTQAGVDGIVNAGMPTVLKLKIAADDPKRMVHIDVAAGVKVLYGFGFVPSASSYSGSVIAGMDGAYFRVPEGVSDVYITLESDTTMQYEIVRMSTELKIIDISKNVLSYGGIEYVDLLMAGLLQDFVAYVGELKVSTCRISDQKFSLEINTLEFPVNTPLDVKIYSGGLECTFKEAFVIRGDVSKGHLVASLILTDSARQGRVNTGYIQYTNDGGADMDAPVFIVAGDMSGTQLSLAKGDVAWTNEVRLVGVSASYPAGKLKVGETCKLPFLYRVVGDYSVKLQTLKADSTRVRSSVFPSYPEYCRALAEAATALNVGKVEYDFETIYAYAMRKAYGQNYGRLNGRLINGLTHMPMSGIELAFVTAEGEAEAGCVTDSEGRWVAEDLNPTYTYQVTSVDCQIDGNSLELTPSNTEVELIAYPFATIKTTTVGLSDSQILESRVYLTAANNDQIETVFTNGAYIASGLSDGVYKVAAICNSFMLATNNVEAVVSNGVADIEPILLFAPCGYVKVVAAASDRSPIVGGKVRFYGEDGIVGCAETDENGVVVAALLPGEYLAEIESPYQNDGNLDFNIIAGQISEVKLNACYAPFVTFPSKGPSALTSEFILTNTNDWGKVFSCKWDFDSDGTIDAIGLNPTNTYENVGTYDVTLFVECEDGRNLQYVRKDAVDVWEPQVIELWSETLRLDADSGYEIVEKTDDSFVVRLIDGDIPIGLWAERVVVIPGEDAYPRKIIEISFENKDRIVCKTEAVEIQAAYRNLRTNLAFGYSTKGVITGSKEYPIFDVPNELEIKSFGTNKFLIEPKVAFPLKASIEITDGNVTRFYASVACNFKCDISGGPRVSTSDKYGDGRVELLYNQTPILPPVLGMPTFFGIYLGADLSVNGYCKATVASNNRVEFSWDKFKGWDPKLVTNENKLEDITFGAELKGNVYLQFIGGIGGGADKDKFAHLIDLDVKAGVKVDISCEKHLLDYTTPDTYKLKAGPKLDGEFNILKVKYGDWVNLTAVNQPYDLIKKFYPGFSIVDYTWSTPIPKVKCGATIREETSDGTIFDIVAWSETEAIDSTLDSRYWIDGDSERIQWQKTFAATRTVAKSDKVVVDINLYETYKPSNVDWLFAYLMKGKKLGVGKLRLTGSGVDDDDEDKDDEDNRDGIIPTSVDPNEMVGPMGVGDSETERYVKPGDWMTYTVYFENKAEATAAAQEVTVTNPLSEYLDWSTFEMGEVAFNNQIDLGLSGKQNGESVVDLKNTNYKVKSTVKLDQKDGKIDWYLRIVDPSTSTGWPDDVFAGFLPPNDETFRGEGHLTYRVKVREDAPALARIDNAATIIFDYNDPIPTDPAWWNTVAPEKLGPKFVDSELSIYEGETAEIKIFGGSTTEETSAKLYLTHNTTTAADIQKGLKFPMTLTWAKGEIGYKTISIPTLVDKAIEDEEFFTCHIDESVITVTIKDAGFEELAAKIEDGTASAAEIKTWQKLVNGKKLYGRAIPSPYEGGKVSGSKAVAAGAKMSFKATANKGYAPIGWFEGDELITKDAAYSFIMPQTNVTYVAKFMRAEEDANEITIDVGGTTGDVRNLMLAATNLCVGVKVEMPVVSSAISATTVKIAKLPAGLKYDAKLGMITGVPTKAGVFNATFTVTTAGKISKVFSMPITTTAMPSWAVGTFNGGLLVPDKNDSEKNVRLGLVTLTTTSAGKISGKILKSGVVNGDLIGQTWTVSAASFDSFDEEGYHVALTAKSGKLPIDTYEIVVGEEGVSGVNEAGEEIEAYQNLWKTDWKDLGKDLAAKYKTGLPLPEGFVFPEEEGAKMTSLQLNFAASGAVSATANFDMGIDAKGKAVSYKSTCSTVLIPIEQDDAKFRCTLYLYFAPNAKNDFGGEAFVLELDLYSTLN